MLAMKLYMQNELGEGENIPEFLSPKRVIFILNSLNIKSMYRHNMTKAFFFSMKNKAYHLYFTKFPSTEVKQRVAIEAICHLKQCP